MKWRESAGENDQSDRGPVISASDHSIADVLDCCRIAGEILFRIQLWSERGSEYHQVRRVDRRPTNLVDIDQWLGSLLIVSVVFWIAISMYICQDNIPAAFRRDAVIPIPPFSTTPSIFKSTETPCIYDLHGHSFSKKLLVLSPRIETGPKWKLNKRLGNKYWPDITTDVYHAANVEFV